MVAPSPNGPVSLPSGAAASKGAARVPAPPAQPAAPFAATPVDEPPAPGAAQACAVRLATPSPTRLVSLPPVAAAPEGRARAGAQAVQ
eukprot:8091471-Alexandrium_andersonii.AAC.1